MKKRQWQYDLESRQKQLKDRPRVKPIQRLPNRSDDDMIERLLRSAPFGFPFAYANGQPTQRYKP